MSIDTQALTAEVWAEAKRRQGEGARLYVNFLCPDGGPPIYAGIFIESIEVQRERARWWACPWTRKGYLGAVLEPEEVGERSWPAELPGTWVVPGDG